MLSHDERRELDEIERHLTQEDPEFVARMRAGPRTSRKIPVLYCLLALTAPILAAAGGLTALGAVVVLIGAVALLRHSVRRRRQRPRLDRP